MQDISKNAQELSEQINSSIQTIDIDSFEKELSDLSEKSQAPGFWDDNQAAQKVMRQIANLENRIRPWRELGTGIKELQELIQLNDSSLSKDIEDQLKKLEKEFKSRKKDLLFNGSYDDHDAIINIHAGAGGTDAQDWAEMLERMYLRWAEANGYETRVIDRSSGDEAGIKSVSIEIGGPFTFGKLQGEHGVHRLVRLSPFNSDNLRQTSFAKVEVLPKIETPEEVEIDEKDLKIDVYRSGGRGGQSVNTTDSAVRITHQPTGITVSIQNERSQLQNKETAMTILRSKLAQLQMEQHADKISQLKGPNEQAAWGNQIRNYVLHPYKQVKDARTGFESQNPEDILNGKIDGFIDAYLDKKPSLGTSTKD